MLAQCSSFDAIVRAGAHFFEQGDQTKALTFRDDLTLRRGDHSIKLGAQVAFLDLTRRVSDHFNGSYFFTNPGAVPSFDFEMATRLDEHTSELQSLMRISYAAFCLKKKITIISYFHYTLCTIQSDTQ